MAFGRKVMRGIRKRMAQERATQRNQQNRGLRRMAEADAAKFRRRRRLANTGNRSSASSSERDKYNKAIEKRQRVPYTKPTDAELRNQNGSGRVVTPKNVRQLQARGSKPTVDPIKSPKRTTRSVKPIEGKGPKPIVDPLRPIKPARHSGELKGGRGGIPALPRRGPQPIVDPLRPSKPAGAKHSGQGRGGRGGIPDVKAPRPYFKGGNVAPTKNAVGTNDYRKTGTTLSVKDNRKKTK